MSESKALTKAEEKQLAEIASMYEDAGGAGLEDADRDSFAIPFLVILQSGSPQVKKSSPGYLPGAEEGNLLNTVDNSLYDVGEKGVKFIPCHFRRAFVEWIPRNDGGGFVGEYAPGSEPKITRDEENRDIIVDAGPDHDGHELYDTRYHYGLLVDNDGAYRPIVIAMTRTQVKKSRRWVSVMGEQKWPDGKTRASSPPTFLYQYELKVTAEQSDEYSWWNWDVTKVGPVASPELVAAAKSFHDAVKGGEVREATESLDEAGSNSASGEAEEAERTF